MKRNEIEKLWIDVREKCSGCFSESMMHSIESVFTIAAKYTYIVEFFDVIVNRFKVIKGE